jgi:hypothetical protein
MYDACPLYSFRPSRNGFGSNEQEKPMKWITRERPKIDRIACPWLIARFIDESPEFLYVPAGDVMSRAAETGAIPYDVPGVELGHHGELCSFDAFIAKYGLKDKALDRLALIVRGADCGRPDLAKESAGLLAISKGLSLNFDDDHEMLRYGMVIYDALYAWCADTPLSKAKRFLGLR